MDLFSLPQEMLASVLKYVNFESLLEIRKISSVIDSTARKYRLPNLILDELSICTEDNGSLRVQLVQDYKNVEASFNLEETKSFTKIFRNVPLDYVLLFYFPKIHRINFILFAGDYIPNHIVINKDAADLLLKHCSLKFNCLYFYFCDLQFDMQLLRQILTTYELQKLSLRVYVTEHQVQNNEGVQLHLRKLDSSPFKDQLFDGLQFDELTLESLSPEVSNDISINCLNQICSRKLPSTISVNQLNVTVAELGEFLEKHLNDTVDTEHLYWSFTVKPGEMNTEQIKQYVNSLKCLKKHTIRIIEPNIRNQVLGFCIFDKPQKAKFTLSKNPDPFLEICVVL